MLQDLVAAGDLPGIEERLPENPRVVTPWERTGSYGGTLRSAIRGAGDQGHFSRSFDYDNLFHWNNDGTFTANLAESIESNEDYTEYVLHLRKGLKWSDGAPYSADDIAFLWDDVYNNAEISAGGPPAWLQNCSVSKIDDYTVRFAFEEPFGQLVSQLARGSGFDWVSHPKHFCQQYHITYNADNMDALLDDLAVENWVDVWNARGTPGNRNKYTVATRPVLWGWEIVTPYTGEATRVELQRNAYYGKVDPEGNQLPYLDEFVFNRYEDAEVIVMAILNGEVDFQNRHVNSIENRPLFTENAEKAGFRLTEVLNSSSSTDIEFNLNHPDPVLNEIFNNKDFRIAVSHAIDREEINQTFYLGSSIPYQPAPRPESIFYHERLATQYTEYDLELADQHLAAAGLTRNSDGKILRPDGEVLSIVLLVEPGKYETEMYIKHLQDWGLDIQFQIVDRALLDQRCDAWDFDVLEYYGVGGADPTNEMPLYLPISSYDSRYARGWTRWYLTNGVEGIEPPDIVKQQYDLWAKFLATGDFDEQVDLFGQILDIAADQFYAIGLVLHPNDYCVVRNEVRNVPELMTDSWPGLARTGYSQFFKEQS